MGVIAAGAGPVFVDRAVVIGHQKGAGCLAEDVVALFVNLEVAFGEFGRFDAQLFSDPVNVAVVEDRADAFAAIGAAQAVYLAEGLFMKGMNTFIQVHLFVAFPQLFEKSLCFSFNLGGTLPEAFCIVIIHWAGCKFFFAFPGTA